MHPHGLYMYLQRISVQYHGKNTSLLLWVKSPCVCVEYRVLVEAGVVDTLPLPLKLLFITQLSPELWLCLLWLCLLKVCSDWFCCNTDCTHTPKNLEELSEINTLPAMESL